MHWHSEPFRLSKLSPLSQTRTHADCSIGAVVELVLLGHQWPPGSVSGPQYLLEERELASLKIPHSSSSLSKADRKTGCDPVITCNRKSFPDRLDRSKDPSQGNRVFEKTSSRARHTLRFGYWSNDTRWGNCSQTIPILTPERNSPRQIETVPPLPKSTSSSKEICKDRVSNLKKERCCLLGWLDQRPVVGGWIHDCRGEWGAAALDLPWGQRGW